MLELDRVSKRVGTEIHIDDVSLRLKRGALHVLLGPTLSGKTSLMRLMAGLDRPTAGHVSMDGTDVTGVAVRKRDVAMVYQQFINYPALTVYENIASPLRIRGADKATIESEVGRAAELLRLTPYLDRTPLNLSGGQQQRTALARAIVKNASLVLLDEPLANLDYKLREELRAELPKIFAEAGTIFVYATTEPSEALLLGGHTATLSEGRVTQFGETVDVYRNPNDLVTAQTFADPPLNLLETVAEGETLSITGSTDGQTMGGGGMAPGRYTFAFPAHQVQLKPFDGALTLSGTVTVAEITGSETYIHMVVCGRPWVALVPGIHHFAAEEVVSVHVDRDRALIFDADGSRHRTEPAKAAA